MMSLKVCLSTANTLMYPQGGHLWVFINWALGLRACGCEVTWFDVVPTTLTSGELSAKYEQLCTALRPFGLDQNIAMDFLSEGENDRLQRAAVPCLESFGPFDLLVDLRYNLPGHILSKFRRRVLINIDPGQYELALARGAYLAPKHDLLFSIGEPKRKDDTFHWQHTPPCVFLDEWPFRLCSTDAPWTTVAHWWEGKREGFAAFMTIPSRVRARFELALNVEHKEEQERIESYGFKVHDAHKIVASPLDYRSFIQNSAGEFSCAKPAYIKFRDAWVSDRSLCYLATGRPCVVQNTGPSRFLPTNKGLHRFSDLDGAVKAIETVMEHYESESRAARLLAEKFFDAHKVCLSLLTRAL
jgi:hypothetical protein